MIEKLIDPVTKILDKFIEDKDLKLQLQHELNQELHKANMAQVEINKIEAGHRSVFVAGWRPFLGWSLSFAMAWHYVLAPLIISGLNFNLLLKKLADNSPTFPFHIWKSFSVSFAIVS